jgi:hypothetical protein
MNVDDKYDLRIKNYRSHAKRRALERYNIFLSDELLDQFNKQIRDKKSNKICNSHDKEEHMITYKGERLRVVWYPTYSTIMTFLPNGSK